MAPELNIPTFGHWALAEMSHRRDIVSDWHGELYKLTPVSADHCARIIRVIYRREARRDRSLRSIADKRD